MSYLERSWVHLIYLYLHASLPQTLGNTVNCSVFSNFQDILGLVKVHICLTKRTGGFISMYWCIYKLWPCVLVIVNGSHQLWRGIPSTCLPDKKSCDIANKTDIMHIIHKPCTLPSSLQAGAYVYFSLSEHCLCNCCAMLQGYYSQCFMFHLS